VAAVGAGAAAQGLAYRVAHDCAVRRRQSILEALRAGLAALGYTEGRNLTIAARYADGDFGRVPVLAEELTRLPVDLIAT
jgi:hypothetical protein